jgi:hypothetical protein
MIVVVAARRLVPGEMRYTTFRFALDPTPVQEEMLARHAGASRFAYNQCRRFVTDALTRKRLDPSVKVPWSGYDLINAFNTWKLSDDAGRMFIVSPDGTVTKHVTGLAWWHKVSAQVFEEAAVDLGHASPPTLPRSTRLVPVGRSASPVGSAKAAAATASGCATSTNLEAACSESERDIRGRSPCPRSGGSGCMTTLVARQP